MLRCHRIDKCVLTFASYLWAFFPRVKSFSFEKMGLTMEIPRVLAVGNVAVRIMDTKYDHLSPLSKSFYPKRKVKPPEVVVEEAPPAEETDGDGVKSIYS